MQFSATAIFAAALALAGSAVAAPNNLEARQEVVTVHLFTGPNGTGNDVPIVAPTNTPLVLGTNIDNQADSVSAPEGYFVEFYDVASGGQCQTLLFTTPIGAFTNLNLPANAVNRAGCIRIRPGF